ncbi:MAG: K+/H+ antiporter [Polyangiaceae bacterium UTPRO1]|jgi:cell volume regulation protein A|nr:potassium/proton antiporter [Myxococcales bacterium]OQY69032.1 MAG: K+/H+ antiporter [Polyangiaceae bacterium UTPRO1]
MSLPPTVFSEPHNTALFMVIVGALIAVSALFSRTFDRLGVPIVLLFLLLGMVGGSEGIGGLEFANHAVAMRLGTIALVLILFDGGLNTTIASIREVFFPATLMATLGVAVTAGLLAVAARGLGLAWPEALLLGAVVSSTDAAAVFAVLRGGSLHLKPRVGRTIEIESCINDPMALVLTMTMIEWMTGSRPLGWRLVLDVPVQLAVGAGVGIGMGRLGVVALLRVRLPTVGLYPALTLAFAFVAFGAATMLHGSGIMAVYAAAVVLGNTPIPYRSGLTRIHDALAWLSQISMFLMFGLLVNPSELLEVAGAGVALAVFLALVARPLAVWPCLRPFGYPAKELFYVSLIGIRGAVPIILATFPALAGVEGAARVFNLVFFIVVASAIFPGAAIRTLTRRLGLDAPTPPAPTAVLEINARIPLHGDLMSFFIDQRTAVSGAPLSEIEFPEGASVVLVVRGDDLIAARGDTVLKPGDHVYLFSRPQDRAWIQLYFGAPEEA